MDREIKKYRYAFAAIFTALIFFTGILFANLMDDYRADVLTQELEEDLAELESRQVQMSYLQEGDHTCQAMQAGLGSIVSSYNERLERMENYRDSTMFQNEEFNDVRRQYTLSGVQYWQFAEEVKNKCDDYNPDLLLYFGEDDCSECDQQRTELDRLKNIHGEDVLIFSVFTDIDDGMVEILKNEYDIYEVPKVAINDEKQGEGLQTAEELSENLTIA